MQLLLLDILSYMLVNHVVEYKATFTILELLFFLHFFLCQISANSRAVSLENLSFCCYKYFYVFFNCLILSSSFFDRCIYFLL